MISLGEIPGGCNRLKHLLYPFHGSYPLKLWSKYRWWRNRNLKSKLSYLNQAKSWLTVIDRLGAPGDALIMQNRSAVLKKYSHLKSIASLPIRSLFGSTHHRFNKLPENFYSFDSTYWELIVRKEKKKTSSPTIGSE